MTILNWNSEMRGTRAEVHVARLTVKNRPVTYSVRRRRNGPRYFLTINGKAEKTSFYSASSAMMTAESHAQRLLRENQIESFEVMNLSAN